MIEAALYTAEMPRALGNMTPVSSYIGTPKNGPFTTITPSTNPIYR